MTEFYEDIKIHQKVRSGEYLLSEEEIIAFATEYDPQPFHIDPEIAKDTRFGGLIASGVQLFALAAKLGNGLMKTALIAGLGIDEMRFLAPVYPGDRLSVEHEVISKRESSSAQNAGIVRFETTLRKQNQEPVLTYKVTSLIAKRPAS